MKKKLITSALLAIPALLLLSGCVAVIGNHDAQACKGTIGQQLVDLQKAKDAGAITEAEFQAQKAKLLEKK